MNQRVTLTFLGITWLYGLAPNAWISQAPGLVVVGKAGANNALYGSGNDLLVGGGGGGDNIFYLGPGDHALVSPDDGVDTVTNYYGTLRLSDGIANGLLTHSGAIFGNADNNVLTATGAGNHTFFAGTADTVMIGSAIGTDRFIVTQGNGAAVIIGFQYSADLVQLNGFDGPIDFATIQRAMTQIGDDVALDLGAGQTLLFVGATTSQFLPRNFALPINLGGWTQTFDDEFDSLSASATGFGTTWWAQTGTLASNKEAENYVNNTGPGGPFSVKDGVLHISATPISSAAGLPYTSGELTSARFFAQTYGYFEISAMLPTGRGMWPAFWLLPASGAWPPELDIMEALGNDPATIYAATHSAVGGTNVRGGLTTAVTNTAATFNTYGADWEPDRITYYFNGNAIGSLPTPADMNQPMYLVINLAVGGQGSWPGPAGGEPGDMAIDYVRAYASPTAVQPPLTFVNWGRTINKGDGTFSITGTGYDGWITLGDGDQTITLTAVSGTVQASGNTITTGNGNQTISVAGAGNTIRTGDGTSTIYAGTDHATVIIGSTPSGATEIIASGYRDIITATGPGNVDVSGTTGAAVVTLLDGDHIISLGGSGNTVTVGTGNSTIDAGTGQAVVHAGGGATITVSGWNNLLDAGPGMNFLNGGSGNDVFVLNAAGQGVDTIAGFNGAMHDVLDITRTLAGLPLVPDFSNLGQFLSTQTIGAGTAISANTTGDGTQGVLIGVLVGVSTSLASLVAHDNLQIAGAVV